MIGLIGSGLVRIQYTRIGLKVQSTAMRPMGANVKTWPSSTHQPISHLHHGQ